MQQVPPRLWQPSNLGQGVGGDEQWKRRWTLSLLLQLLQAAGLYLRLFHASITTSWGFTRALFGWDPWLEVPNYSTTCLRVNRLDIGLVQRLDLEKPVTLVVDASRAVADWGRWIRLKWKKRRGFLKIHISVDVKMKQIVAMDLTDERSYDGKAKPLLEQTEEHCRIVKSIADGTYNSCDNFTVLAKNGIEATIKVRKNSSGRAIRCPA